MMNTMARDKNEDMKNLLKVDVNWNSKLSLFWFNF